MTAKLDTKRSTRPTLRTLAEFTGMAMTTVSRALNDAPDISQKTKKRVRAAADELGYQPVRSSVQLRTGKSFNIAFVNDHTDERPDFARRMIVGITTVLRDTSYQLYICPQFRDLDDAALIRDLVRTEAVDGIIFSHTRPQDERVKFLIENDFPFVTHGRTELASPHPYYDLDTYQFTLGAAERLIGLGCRNITLIAPNDRLTSFGHGMQAMAAATRRAGIEPYVFNEPPITDADVAKIHALATERARAGNIPDGVICGNELTTLAIMDAFQNEGLVIGEDVKFVSRRTTSILSYTRPRIDTIFEDLTKAGETMAKFLLKRIENASINELQLVEEPKFTWSES